MATYTWQLSYGADKPQSQCDPLNGAPISTIAMAPTVSALLAIAANCTGLRSKLPLSDQGPPALRTGCCSVSGVCTNFLTLSLWLPPFLSPWLSCSLSPSPHFPYLHPVFILYPSIETGAWTCQNSAGAAAGLAVPQRQHEHAQAGWHDDGSGGHGRLWLLHKRATGAFSARLLLGGWDTGLNGHRTIARVRCALSASALEQLTRELSVLCFAPAEGLDASSGWSANTNPNVPKAAQEKVMIELGDL
eukprot:1158377-Pelagomonas_calceolata.AAC.9